MRKIWKILPSDSEKIEILTSSLGISSILAQLLLNRNIDSPLEAEKFLFKSFYDLPDPYQLKDMENTTERLKKSIKNKEKIMILGDYDVDGLTSLALIYEFLIANAVPVYWYLPHRLEEGYGISENAIRQAKEKKVDLFISLDCGITAFEEIKSLKNSGIDVLIIDHHRPRGNLYPPADAIIDPWQSNCPYPEKNLTSVGLVFKVLQALLGSHNEELVKFLDLVCLGTIADVASLRGENRILVKYGLETLRNTSRLGLKELFRVTGIDKKNINVRSISYIIAPRLNALGRIDSADDALRLLISKSEKEAKKLAKKLDSSNRKRQTIETHILKEVYTKIDQEIDFSRDKIIIISGKDWHLGVLGIIASRLTDRYFRPAIVLSESEGLLKGSGRSIPDFNIFQAVSKFEQLLEEFGGHAAACGVTLKKENLNDFKTEFNKYASYVYEKAPFLPKLKLDKILDFSEINDNLFNDLDVLSPYGTENPEPLFLNKSVKVITKPRALAWKFYKFWVKKGNISFQALFKDKDGDNLPQEGDLIDIAYTPSEEEWEGVKSITLFLEDFREAVK